LIKEGEGVKNFVILGFDIGNTNTKAGIYNAETIVPEATFRFPTVKNSDQTALSGMVGEGIAQQELRQGKIDVSGLVFSSVVPEINRSYHELAEKIYGIDALEISYKSRLNISIAYDDPRELGADRIVNAAAAFHEYGGGIVIVDMGTAVTFGVLLENGVFEGGIIAPGIDTAIKSLSGRASRLPEVAFERPDRVVARDTVNSLKSGFFYGWISLAEGIIGRIRNECGTDFRIILTGGYAPSMADHLGFKTIVDPLLSMKGIKLLYDMNAR